MADAGGPAAGSAIIRVVLVDDDPLIRSGWETMLSAYPGIQVVGVADDGLEAVARGADADVVLMDIRMPRMNGLDATRELTGRSPQTRVVVVTTFESDHLVWAALRAGAVGYVLKRAPAADLVDAIHLVHDRDKVFYPDALRRIAGAHRPTKESGPALTIRERDVLTQLARGLTNGEIAAALFVTRETVKTHVRAIIDKLDAKDRTHAVVRAYERGILVAGVSAPTDRRRE